MSSELPELEPVDEDETQSTHGNHQGQDTRHNTACTAPPLSVIVTVSAQTITRGRIPVTIQSVQHIANQLQLQFPRKQSPGGRIHVTIQPVQHSANQL